MCIKTTFLQQVLHPVNALKNGQINSRQFSKKVAKAPMMLASELEKNEFSSKDVSFILDGATNLSLSEKSDPPQDASTMKLLKKFAKRIVTPVSTYALSHLTTDSVSNKQKKELSRKIESILRRDKSCTELSQLHQAASQLNRATRPDNLLKQ